jgi:hypothetical protein
MSQQHLIMNGGESPLASKLKKSDAITAESFQQSGSILNDGGAAPTSGQTPAPTSTTSSSAETISLAKGGGIVRARAKK